jgi:secondary thiamine-phosphate synthase enzyme
MTLWRQTEFALAARARGVHKVTDEVLAALPWLGEFAVGILHLHILHTSASLALQENADPAVLRDLAAWLDRAVPEDAAYWTHREEGPDDMPAHVKAMLTGPSLMLPIRDGRLALGTWQGILLCEHRNHGGSRRLIATGSGAGR